MTFRDYERAGVSVSRLEEQRGWLGRVKVDPSERGAFAQADDPTDEQEQRAGQ